MRTLAGNGEPGFVDGQEAEARFNNPTGLELDKDERILVTHSNYHSVQSDDGGGREHGGGQRDARPET